MYNPVLRSSSNTSIPFIPTARNIGVIFDLICRCLIVSLFFVNLFSLMFLTSDEFG
jgi:hypothetical protein